MGKSVGVGNADSGGVRVGGRVLVGPRWTGGMEAVGEEFVTMDPVLLQLERHTTIIKISKAKRVSLQGVEAGVLRLDFTDACLQT
jgi:hypothetical protein